MKLVLATKNKNKIFEIEKLLKQEDINDIEVVSMAEIGFNDDIVEDGKTFEENARIKARAIANLGYIAAADDSGLCVDALDGAPGIYSARFSGSHGNDADNNRKLLELLADTPDDKRTAHYTASIVCIFPETGKEIAVTGTCEGVILREGVGEGGFGYDPLFYFPSLGKTFAQLTPDEKNAVSHRGNAIRLFAKEFKKIL